MRKVKRGSSRRKVFSPPFQSEATSSIPSAPEASSLPPDLRNCGNLMTPACLRALYNTPTPRSIKVGAGDLGFYEELDEVSRKDLDKFFAIYAPYVPQGTYPINDTINPPQTDIYIAGEADLDFEVAYGVLGPANITLYQTGAPMGYRGNNTLFGPFFDAIDASFCTVADRKAGFQCGRYNLTDVVSFSYGTPELFYNSAAFERRTCNEIMKLTLQGHTFVFSTGDYGVASNHDFSSAPPCYVNGCIPQDLQNTGNNSFNGTIFSPQFPATCPYVLAVGATQLAGNQTVKDPESVLQQVEYACGPTNAREYFLFGSGGGFSNYFQRPSYQNATVNAYLAKYVPKYKYYIANGVDVQSNNTNIGQNGAIYNRAGRAFPDVAANGWNTSVVVNGQVGTSSGTSTAAPLWASIISLLNSERAAMGKSPVGFINPALYQHPEVFNDITIGANPGCGTDGFPAVPGWDPSTGLGTPDFPALSSLFRSLP